MCVASQNILSLQGGFDIMEEQQLIDIMDKLRELGQQTKLEKMEFNYDFGSTTALYTFSKN